MKMQSFPRHAQLSGKNKMQNILYTKYFCVKKKKSLCVCNYSFSEKF